MGGKIATLCTCIKMLKVTRNQQICSSDTPPNCLYFLIKGCADEHVFDNGKELQRLIKERKNGANKPSEGVPKHKKNNAKKRKKLDARKQTRSNARVAQKKRKPEMHRLATLPAGQMFGEASWLYGQQGMTTVIARSECKLWVLPFVHVT